jgi:hypothetical protein
MRHGLLLVQHDLLVGQEHGRTIQQLNIRIGSKFKLG